MDLDLTHEEEERQTGPAAEQGMQHLAARQRAGMVGVADGGVGAGPAPGADGGAAED